MKFGNPIWLWGVALIPLLYFLVLLDEKNRKARFARFAQQELWHLIAPLVSFERRRRKSLFLVIAFGFLCLALARPQFGSHEEVVQVAGLDIAVVLDVSSSMDAEDVVPSRLAKAKHFLKAFSSRLSGDRMGLIAFAQSSFVACPLTTDLDYFSETVQAISTHTIQNQGTDIGTALQTAVKALERGSLEGSGPRPASEFSRVILLVSDGEDHEDLALSVASEIQRLGIKLLVFGVGTEKGGPILIRGPQGNQGYKRDRSGQVVVTTFKPDFLRKLSDRAGGKYWALSETEVEGEEALRDLGALERSNMAERKYTVYEERFQIPLFLACILLAAELALRLRKPKPIQAVLFLLLLLNSAPVCFANDLPALKPSRIKPGSLEVYLENKKGIDAFSEGRFADAEREFGAAQARDPKNPELKFNQGVVQLKQGEAEAAAQAFQDAADRAAKGGLLELEAKSRYNLGSALTQKGDARGAVQAYLDSINLAKKMGNEELENRARRNLQLLVEPPPPPQSQQSQQKDDKKNQEQDQKQNQNSEQKNEADQQSKQSKDQKDGGKGQEKQDQKNQQGEQNKDQKDSSKSDQKDQPNQPNQPNQKNEPDQSKQGEDQGKQKTSEGGRQGKFQSKKMDAQDAERVMSDLRNRERELQERLNTKNGRPESHDRDW